MKRKDVPKKTKATPTAPLVLIWEMILVVTVACSTSVQVKRENVVVINIRDVIVHFFWAKSLESFNHSKNSERKWELVAIPRTSSFALFQLMQI